MNLTRGHAVGGNVALGCRRITDARLEADATPLAALHPCWDVVSKTLAESGVNQGAGFLSLPVCTVMNPGWVRERLQHAAFPELVSP